MLRFGTTAYGQNIIFNRDVDLGRVNSWDGEFCHDVVSVLIDIERREEISIEELITEKAIEFSPWKWNKMACHMVLTSFLIKNQNTILQTTNSKQNTAFKSQTLLVLRFRS